MRLTRSGQIEKSRKLLHTLLSTAIFCAASYSAAASTCGFESSGLPAILARATSQMQEGDYIAFVGTLEAEGKSPPEDSLTLAADLENYSSEGFSECIVAREDLRPNSQSFFLIFKDREQDNERVLYVFFMLARIGDSWQFIKTQVSTNFDEVYQFVR
jgi:hypothetical protein